MLDVIFESDRRLAKSWRTDAAKRRRLSANDQVADALEYCAGELEAQISELEQTSHWLTVAEYASLKLVSEQTVRNWIRRGELDAEKDGKGSWVIARGTEKKTLARRAS